MQIAKEIAGFSPAEADDLRKAIGKKIHALMASLKDKFLEGCAQNGVTPAVATAALEGHGAGAGLLLQQVPRRLLRADRLPDRLAEGEPPVRVHGRADLVRDEHEGQGPVLRQRVRRDRDRGAAAGRELVADRLRRRRGEDPLRPQRGEGRGRGGGARDHRGPGRGRAVRRRSGTSPSASIRSAPTSACSRRSSSAARSTPPAPRGRGCSPCSSRRSRSGTSSRPTGSPARARSSTSATRRARRRRRPRHHPPVPSGEFDKNELLRMEKEVLGLYVSEHPLHADPRPAPAEDRRDDERARAAAGRRVGHRRRDRLGA